MSPIRLSNYDSMTKRVRLEPLVACYIWDRLGPAKLPNYVPVMVYKLLAEVI